MASAARIDDDDEDGGGVYNAPDAKTALKIYKEEIAPRKAFIAEKRGDLSDPYKRIKDECHFPRKVLDFVTSLADEEDAKRDHILTALHLGLTELNLSRPLDLVSMAEGASAGDAVVPAGARGRPDLVVVGDDDDPDFSEVD